MNVQKITAFLLSAITACACLTGCAKKEEEYNSWKNATLQTTAPAESGTASETLTVPLAETEQETTEHISPREELKVQSGTQKDYTNAVLNHDTNKIYPLSLGDFLKSGDSVQKFIFEFEADGNIGTFQGGFGISVDATCKAATDDYWYQSENFSVPAEGSYVRVEWEVPPEIREHVNPTGKLQVGYWWGDTENITLKYVTCCYTRTAEIPVDDTQTLPVHQSMNYQTSPSLKFPLGSLLQENGVPQAVTVNISAGSAFGKFNGGFRIRTGAEEWYESETLSFVTDSDTLTITWLIPENVKKTIPQDTELEFDYFWSECTDISLDEISIKYSWGSGGQAGSLSNAEEIQVAYRNDDAERIAKNIKVGWNLGNSLDCYDITWSTADFETAWGNPKTTKQMIDSVKAAGFNAVRIPVSWTDHVDEEGTIDSVWLKRVQQVVDYAMDNGLYTVLNMHHDDYTWLTPIYYKEEAVTKKYVRIWSQIAERFKNYDTKLLFEGLNEPRMIDSENEWSGGTAEERDVINHLLQNFVDTVRNSGGKNSMRTLVITTQAASIQKEALDGLVIPKDDNLIVSVHHYAPWKFTSYDYPEETKFTPEDREQLNYEFDLLKQKFTENGIPVIIGEFGAENKENTAERAAYYEYYLKAAKERGIPCFIWDNNIPEGKGSYGLFNRSDFSWYYPEILTAIQNAVK